MADRPLDLVGVVGNKHVAFFNGAIPDFQKLGDKATELAHQHLALAVRDHIEFVLLLPNGRGHATPEHHHIHLAADGGQGS